MTTESLIVELDAKTATLDTKIKKTEANFDSLGREIQSTDKSLDNLNKTGMQVSKTALAVNKGVGGIGRSAGQAGIQVQQFVGQIQGGQNAMLALSAQSADLGFVLGAPLVGAIVGIGASLVGILAPSFFKTAEAAKDFKFEVTEATKELEKLDDLSKAQVAVAVQEVNKTITELSKESFEASTNIAALNQKLASGVRLNTEFTKTGRAIVTNVKLTAEEIRNLTDERDREQARLDKINKQRELEAELLVKLGKGREGIAKTDKEAVELTKQQEESLSKLISSLREGAETYGLSSRELAIYRANRIGATEADIESINASFDVIDAEKKKQEELAKGNALFGVGTTEGDPAILAQIITQEEVNAQRLLNEQAYIDAVNQIRLTGQETAEEILARDIEANRLALENKLITLEQFNSQQAAATEKFAKTDSERNKKQNKTAKQLELEKLNATQTTIRAGMALANVAFEDNKAINAGLVVADTAAGIQKSLAIAPYDYANVALIAATGVANLASVLGAEKGGGSISATPQGTLQQDVQQASSQEVSTLDLTEQDEGGVQTLRVVFDTADGDNLLDALATGIDDRKRTGR